jgi:hypothetical protein
MPDTYHRLVRGSHSRWFEGARTIHKTGTPTDHLRNLSDAELATLGDRVVKADGPPDYSAAAVANPVSPAAEAAVTAPVKPRENPPNTTINAPPSPSAPRAEDYTYVTDANAADAVELINGSDNASEVEGMKAAEEASGSPRKTVIAAADKKIAELRK